MLSNAIAIFDRSLIRRAGKVVLQNLSLSIKPGQAHVVVGPLGSGKSSLLLALHGDLPVEPPQSLTFPFLARKRWPGEVIQLLTGKAEMDNGSAYYAERYHSRREDDHTLRQWLSLNAEKDMKKNRVESIARDLSLMECLDSSVINLSNGQSKRALIARALLKEPSCQVLLLDEPYVGLDVEARKNLSRVLGALHRCGHPHVILALRPLDDIPDWATHVLWLNTDGSIRAQGLAEDIKPQIEKEASTAKKLRSLPVVASEPLQVEVVRLEKVSVAYWGKLVLNEISWTIHAGSRWHLSGSNGSGKTTLLAMILGDHPKMYTNDIHIFGQRPGIGMSVFDIQAQMGHSSPEIHRHFPRYQTGQQCLASAFAESFLPKAALSENEQKLIDQIAAYFYVASDLDSQLRDMAPAKQRLFLLLRALVKMPRLIVLDEPFAGMDADMIERAKVYLDTQLSQEQSLIFVTHYDDEVPSTVNRRLRLDGGSVVEQV